MIEILNQPAARGAQLSAEVEVADFPHPYRAMLAICSDLDETADAETYFELMRFLNATEQTSSGLGASLEVGNSIYFDMPPDQFAYWNTDDKGRAMARALIESGHIDCLHSYGDLATTRAHAARALDELNRHDLSLKVWVDHATAPTNFGADIMRGHGDETGHPAYHADLTLACGVRYVWRGRVTSIVGQDRSVSFGNWNSSFVPGTSARARLKETAKHLLARGGNDKYEFHAGNRLCRTAELRDGQSIIEFMRCNPHPAGLDFGDEGHCIGEVLTREFLDRLIERNGCSILYTHLGKLRGSRCFCPDAVRGFQLLAEYERRGDILVTTTRRLLEFHDAKEKVSARSIRRGDNVVLEIEMNGDAAPDGLTFYVEASGPITVTMNGEEVQATVNPSDRAGRRSVSIPWRRLTFPSNGF